MSLLDRIRKHVRVTARQVADPDGRTPIEDGYVPTYSSPFDEELNMLISAAERDLLRVGIREELVYPQDGEIGADVEQCITLYVKQHFGYDNVEADRFGNSYRMAVIELMSSPANSSYGDIEEPEEESKDETVWEPVDEYVDPITGEVVKKPVNEPVEEPTQEQPIAEEPVKEEPVDELLPEVVDDTLE